MGKLYLLKRMYGCWQKNGLIVENKRVYLKLKTYLADIERKIILNKLKRNLRVINYFKVCWIK